MNSDSIPVDLITEILSRLPTKSIARFRCVSKLWSSILSRPYFTELFLTRSSAKPRILFAIKEAGVWSFFSMPQRLISPYEKLSLSLVVTAEFHMKFPPDNMRICPTQRRYPCAGYASGLIFFYDMCIQLEGYTYGVPVICSPNTGQYKTLPYHLKYSETYSFFGFDPIDKQFKVLFMAYPGRSDDHKIMTLGTRKIRWMSIKCPLPHDPLSEGICINGVLDYLGDCAGYVSSNVVDVETYDNVIVCFDVRSEKFKFIYLQDHRCELINYKGKLCVIYWGGGDYDHYWKKDVDAIELHVWVLEDAEKHEWSKYMLTLCVMINS